MKKVFVFLLLTSSLIRGQESVEQIHRFESSKKQILSKIDLLNDSINKIDLKINALQFENFQKIALDSSLFAIVVKNAKIKKTPDVMGDIILTLEEDKKVIILDYHNEYFDVCIGSVCGYVSYSWIRGNELELSKFIRSKKQQELEKSNENLELRRVLREREINEGIAQDLITERENIKKYGKVVYDKLKQGYYWLGMTNEMALISLGSPKDNNRSVGSWGIHEQWVYNGLYLYFENGKLKSYQN